jgi:hypothetical protein
MSSVSRMRRSVLVVPLLAAAFLAFSPTVVSSATTTTSVPVLCPPSTDTSGTTIPVAGCVAPLVTTTTSTTTTTLPSAVTTVPEGCALPPTALAVFVGKVISTDPVNAVFDVFQMRAGSLEGYITNNEVEIRYGADVKYLETGKSYIVGANPDSVSLKLSSTIRDSAELFGGAQVVGSSKQCPVFEAAARTLHTDGTAISASILGKLFEQPWRIAVAFLVPPVLVLMGLFGLVWLRRGTKPAKRPVRKK